MNKVFRRIYSVLLLFGIDPVKGVKSLSALPGYYNDMKIFKKQAEFSSGQFNFGKAYPCLLDKLNKSGSLSHYFHQDLFVARRIFLNNPKIHVDIGSRIDGFVGHIASFRKIEVFDIRPLANNIPNITFTQLDLMTSLRNELFDYCDSLSCLHSLEHFGLGRYGDSLNYDGYLLGLENLYKILLKGGKFYFSVPIGPQRIEFNAHRVFSLDYLVNYFSKSYDIEKFAYVDDAGELHEDVCLESNERHNNFGCNYGCGIFEMVKR